MIYNLKLKDGDSREVEIKISAKNPDYADLCIRAGRGEFEYAEVLIDDIETVAKSLIFERNRSKEVSK